MTRADPPRARLRAARAPAGVVSADAILDAGRALAFHQHARGGRVREHREVGALDRGLEIADRGAVAQAPARRVLEIERAFVAAVVVIVEHAVSPLRRTRRGTRPTARRTCRAACNGSGRRSRDVAGSPSGKSSSRLKIGSRSDQPQPLQPPSRHLSYSFGSPRTKRLPLIELEPPITRPRVHFCCLPFRCVCGSVMYGHVQRCVVQHVRDEHRDVDVVVGCRARRLRAAAPGGGRRPRAGSRPRSRPSPSRR